MKYYYKFLKRNCLNNLTFGRSEGNSGAIVRWGKYLDNGIWITVWKFRRLWFKGWKIQKHYINLGFFTVQWGN